MARITVDPALMRDGILDDTRIELVVRFVRAQSAAAAIPSSYRARPTAVCLSPACIHGMVDTPIDERIVLTVLLPLAYTKTTDIEDAMVMC